MMREQQISHNLKAVANAVAQQTLEELKVPPDVVEEMNRAARGKSRSRTASAIQSVSSRMSRYQGNDHYLDPETGVLKNKLGIRDEKKLNEAEASLSAWRSFQLAENPIEGRFDLDHLKAIHKHLFFDVYEWAGELRNIDLSKENSYFANHVHLVGAARPVFEKLADEHYLEGLDAVVFSARAAYYLGEINALHPFCEGNGRAPREYINHLAFRNGYFIEWKNISQEDMIQASIESFHQADNTKFAAFIRDNLREIPVL